MPGGEGYPKPLLSQNAPPPLLFARGEWRPSDARAVALVGTRTPTPFGREAAFSLARGLAENGVTVVSGLALGIDAAAHAGALEGGGRTVAVMGCGPDVDYPQANRSLRERIPRQGVLLSEFPPGEQPLRSHFPRRNRVLSALSRATVVIEAGARSGALITAAYARAQGKALFAVPGSMFSRVSVGTHALLRDGARLCSGIDDLAGCLDLEESRPVAPNSPKALAKKVTDAGEDPVLSLWRDEETCGLDLLSERARTSGHWPPERALAALLPSLLRLEIRGRVQRLPGPLFRKVPSGALARVGPGVTGT
jgi:DNA processing protein